ncbi:hypothetical protein [Mucilaginibacter pedocola]|uniref:Uncharacterized protein n=1 Tax=Mucilaginibacter pedocola TaxID=1792845 RepID=A0A1S9PKG7_9SPHI|nr:hypothetical protein [Mucilaginibacter pedocola]OOQ61440.1 hypothetical protein BC343_20980 [Mucilaginibacter pedocola]
MQILLEDIIVYTWTGRKHLYKLRDNSYGQWLVFKDGLPVYYLDVFDELYAGLEDSLRYGAFRYLEEKFKRSKDGYSMDANINGIWSSTINDKWFELEMLPLSFFEY